MPHQSPRGTSDILPEEQPYWSYIRHQAIRICKLYGYRRIDTPTFEDSQLFERSIGEETDIVEKEMYTFQDRSGTDLTLRPEGTASICRAYIQHGMHNLPQPVRLYYFADIFRYERPQAGRYRQHHQFGIEAIGESDPVLDAEVIDIAWQLYSNLGLRGLSLYLNSIGCSNCRPGYLKTLESYYVQHKETLCADCKRRLKKNTLRLLDCKNPNCVPLTEQAPPSTAHLCQECSDHFDKLQTFLKAMNLPITLNHRLVRGLDYYNRTVFEIAPEGETAQQVTIGGGGRYDNLIEEIGGKPTPAVGFATGIERLVLNLKNQTVPIPATSKPAVFIAYLGNEAKEAAIRLTAQLRASGIAVISSIGDRSLKAQLRQAGSTGARYAIIIGDDEVKSGTVVLKDMEKGEQETIPQDNIVDKLSKTPD